MANKPELKVGNISLCVLPGDLTQIDVDAIITAINSEGAWFGGIDGAIYHVAGGFYHDQVREQIKLLENGVEGEVTSFVYIPGNGAFPVKKSNLKDLDVIIAKGDKTRHKGKFDDIVFVVDDLNCPLDKIVYSGLDGAAKECYRTLAVPMMRMGVMLGTVEKSVEETLDKMLLGTKNFLNKHSIDTTLNEIDFVVYRDNDTLAKLSEKIKTL